MYRKIFAQYLLFVNIIHKLYHKFVDKTTERVNAVISRVNVRNVRGLLAANQTEIVLLTRSVLPVPKYYGYRPVAIPKPPQ